MLLEVLKVLCPIFVYDLRVNTMETHDDVVKFLSWLYHIVFWSVFGTYNNLDVVCNNERLMSIYMYVTADVNNDTVSSVKLFL